MVASGKGLLLNYSYICETMGVALFGVWRRCGGALLGRGEGSVVNTPAYK
jgi:hypothetical protein